MSKLIETASLWLNPLGYSIFHRSADNGWANYIHMEKKASIEVYYKNNEMVCKAQGFLGKSFNTVSTPEFSLGNKNIFLQIRRIEAALNAYDTYCQDLQN